MGEAAFGGPGDLCMVGIGRERRKRPEGGMLALAGSAGNRQGAVSCRGVWIARRSEVRFH